MAPGKRRTDAEWEELRQVVTAYLASHYPDKLIDEDREDLTQEVLAAVIDKPDAKIQYIFAIAKNKTADHFRRKKRRAGHLLRDEGTELDALAPVPSSRSIKAEGVWLQGIALPSDNEDSDAPDVPRRADDYHLYEDGTRAPIVTNDPFVDRVIALAWFEWKTNSARASMQLHPIGGDEFMIVTQVEPDVATIAREIPSRQWVQEELGLPNRYNIIRTMAELALSNRRRAAELRLAGIPLYRGRGTYPLVPETSSNKVLKSLRNPGIKPRQNDSSLRDKRKRRRRGNR